MEKSKPRSSKACDRCRLKKVKCDGSYPCARCTKDDVACVFGSRGKGQEARVSANHVEQLQAQTEILKLALKTIWAKYVKPTLPVGATEPSIHELCRQVGALDSPDLRHIHRSASELLFQDHSNDTSPIGEDSGEISEEEDLPDVPPLMFDSPNDAPGFGVELPHSSSYGPIHLAASPQNLDTVPIPTFAPDDHSPFVATWVNNGPYLHGPTLLSHREPLQSNGFGRQQPMNMGTLDQKHYYGDGPDIDYAQ